MTSRRGRRCKQQQYDLKQTRRGTTYWSTNNRPMTTTHFLSWRPYHVTLCNLL